MVERARAQGARESAREQILAAAADELCERGWSGLGVASLARRAGVRRQSVYELVGTKSDLGRALVEQEARRHLAEVVRCLVRAPTPAAALTDAARFVLRDVARDRLVVAVLGAGGAPEPELVTVMTTDAGSLLTPALTVVSAALASTFPAVPEDRARMACAVVVRLTLSHLLQPSGSVEDALSEVSAVATAMFSPDRT